MRRFAALACALVLLAPARGSGDESPQAAPPAAPAPPPHSTIVGHHVEASGDVPAEVLEEAASLGDQLVPLLATHFEAEVPKSARPLRVVIHATQAAFRAAVRAEGGTEADLQHAGGYTPKQTLVSHLWLQDEPFDTRRLVLHELTHQVQDKTFAEFGPGTDTEWHREGLAEHFGWHVRGKNGLEVGRVDAIARSTRPSEFVRMVYPREIDAWTALVGGKPVDYTLSLGFVHSLLARVPQDLRARFRAWEREAWRRRDAAARFEAAFGSEREALVKAVRDGWKPWQPRYTVVRGGWDEQGSRILGVGSPDGWLALGLPPSVSTGPQPLPQLGVQPAMVTRARATLTVDGTGSAGVQLARRNRLMLERRGTRVRLMLRREGKDGMSDTAFNEWSLPPGGPEEVRLSLECRFEKGPPIYVAQATWAGGGGAFELTPEVRRAAGVEFEQSGAPGLFVVEGKHTFADVDLSYP